MLFCTPHPPRQPAGCRGTLALQETGDRTWRVLDGRFTMNGIVPGQYELFAWQDILQGTYQNEDCCFGRIPLPTGEGGSRQRAG